MQLVPNYSNVLIVLSCIIGSFSCKDNSNDYLIETSPYTLCTVHLQTFATSFSEMHIFRKIVNANQNGNIIWTILNGNASIIVKPLLCIPSLIVAQRLIRRYDQCTLLLCEVNYLSRSSFNSVRGQN
jgi:hypothetical protein